MSFEVIRVLEERSNGEEVLLAERHLRHGLAGYVVVKRLRDPARFELRQRLIEEVQLAFRLHHPVIAQVHHLRVLEKVPYVIMEYVDGQKLDSLITAAAMGRREAAEEVARLFTDASGMRDVAEPVESGIYPACLDAHELPPGSGERRT